MSYISELYVEMKVEGYTGLVSILLELDCIPFQLYSTQLAYKISF